MNWFYCYSWWWDDTTPVGTEQKSWGVFMLLLFVFFPSKISRIWFIGTVFQRGCIVLCWSPCMCIWEEFISGCESLPLQLCSCLCDTPPSSLERKITEWLSDTHLCASVMGKLYFCWEKNDLYITYTHQSKNNFKQSLHAFFHAPYRKLTLFFHTSYFHVVILFNRIYS